MGQEEEKAVRQASGGVVTPRCHILIPGPVNMLPHRATWALQAVQNLLDYLDRPNLIIWGLRSGGSFLVSGERVLIRGCAKCAAAGFKDGEEGHKPRNEETSRSWKGKATDSPRSSRNEHSSARPGF